MPTPVDYDPFAKTKSEGKAVDYDPFSPLQRKELTTGEKALETGKGFVSALKRTAEEFAPGAEIRRLLPIERTDEGYKLGKPEAMRSAESFIKAAESPVQTAINIKRGLGDLATSVISPRTKQQYRQRGEALEMAGELIAGGAVGAESIFSKEAARAAEQAAARAASLAGTEASDARTFLRKQHEAAVDLAKSEAEAARAEELQSAKERATKTISAARAAEKEAATKARVASEFNSEMAAERAGLPATEVTADSPKGAVGRDARAAVLNKFRTEANSVSGEKAEWDNYRKVYEARDEELSPLYSEEGRQLKKTLDSIAQPRGRITPYSIEMQNKAKTLIRALQGADGPAVATNVIDDIYRSLREEQQAYHFQGATAITRKNAKDLADDIEKFLKSYVGEENYPRGRYAKANETLNKMSTPLFQKFLKLTEGEKTEYLRPGVRRRIGYETPESSLMSELFSSGKSVREFAGVMGDDLTSDFAARHVSNELYGKTSAEARKWFESQLKNGWIKEIPEVKNMAEDYIQKLAIQEGSTARLTAEAAAAEDYRKRTRKMWADRIKEIKTKEYGIKDTVQALEKSRAARENLVNDAVSFLAGPEPKTMLGKFDQEFANKLLSEGILDDRQLQGLRREIGTIDRRLSAAQKRERLKNLFTKYLIPVAGGAIGAGYVIKGAGKLAEAFGGD